MKKTLPTAILIALPVVFLCLSFVNAANEGLGVAHRLEIQGDNIKYGSIVSANESQNFLSQEAYDKNMIGVVVEKPALEINSGNGTGNTFPVMAEGTVPVLISGENGPIEKGDRITSSSVPGIGMKATKTGFTLGTAQANHTLQSKEETTTIPVYLNIKFTYGEDSPASELISQRLLNMVSLSTIAAMEEPKEIFRHTIAGLIVVSSIAFSFFTFGKVVRNGVEGVARNPLSKNSILFGMIFNLVINLAIVGAGLGAAYIIVYLP